MSTGAKGEDFTQFIVVGAVGLITLGGLAYCFLRKGDKKEEVSEKDLETKENKNHTEHKDTKVHEEKKEEVKEEKNDKSVPEQSVEKEEETK